MIEKQHIKNRIVSEGGAEIIKKAPTGILVLYDKRTKNTEYQDHLLSGAAAIQNMLLAATFYEIGSCWICHLPSKRKLKKMFNIPRAFDPIGYVALGYPKTEPREVPRKYSFKEIVGHDTCPKFPQEKVSNLFLYRIFRKIYYLLPKSGFLNKMVIKMFEKKYENIPLHFL